MHDAPTYDNEITIDRDYPLQKENQPFHLVTLNMYLSGLSGQGRRILLSLPRSDDHEGA